MKRIREVGIGRIVVLDVRDGWFRGLVDDIIVTDDAFSPLIDPKNPETDIRIQAIQRYVREKNITFDGVWTFADKSVVLCAQIARYLGTAGIDPTVIAHLKNKQSLRRWLFEHADALSQQCPHIRSLPSLHIDSIKTSDFPLILKGVESVGKSLVQVIRTQKDLDKSLEKYDKTSITAEPYFEGTDFDLNVLVRNGQIVWHGFVENSPPIHSFLENGSLTCACLNESEQAEVLRYAQNIITHADGIDAACLHIEFRARHDENGFSATLIEINFRMGGVENFVFHLGQDNQDLIRANMELAFGIPLSQANVPLKSGPYTYIRTADLYTHKTGILRHLKGPLQTAGILEYLFFAEIGMDCQYPPRGCIFDEIGWIVTGSKNSQEEANLFLEQARKNIIVDIQ